MSSPPSSRSGSSWPSNCAAFHSDNGSEFLNGMLLDYCRGERIALGRSRPYRKNNNARQCRAPARAVELLTVDVPATDARGQLDADQPRSGNRRSSRRLASIDCIGSCPMATNRGDAFADPSDLLIHLGPRVGRRFGIGPVIEHVGTGERTCTPIPIASMSRSRTSGSWFSSEFSLNTRSRIRIRLNRERIRLGRTWCERPPLQAPSRAPSDRLHGLAGTRRSLDCQPDRRPHIPLCAVVCILGTGGAGDHAVHPDQVALDWASCVGVISGRRPCSRDSCWFPTASGPPTGRSLTRSTSTRPLRSRHRRSPSCAALLSRRPTRFALSRGSSLTRRRCAAGSCDTEGHREDRRP